MALIILASPAFSGCAKPANTVPNSLAGELGPSTTIAPGRRSPLVPPTTTPPLTGEDTIISADVAWWDTFLAVASHNPVDPSDPKLAQHAAGMQLVNERAALIFLLTHHYHDMGIRTRTQYRVAEHVGDSAVVTSCDSDRTEIVDDVSGKVAAPAPNTSSLVNHRLELTNGRWKVVDSATENKSC
ncbi:MAG: hypothetical protein M3N98_06885 [Actinomycetota bacterium]|nr:hypothetical protein [Actinomycetota bacterium]